MGQSEQQDVATTIRYAAALLAAEARRVKLDTLAYLLDMAELDHLESGLRGLHNMRELLFCVHTALAAVFLIGGVALAIESWFGGWGLGLILAMATVNGGAFVMLAILFAATAVHLGRSGLT